LATNHLFAALNAAIPLAGMRLAETADSRIETYGDTLALSARLAALLVARGVKPGDRVAVQVEKSWTAFALYLATVRAGAVYLPLNTAYTTNELEYFISDAAPALFVCRPEMEAEARTLAGRHGVSALETLGSDGQGSLSQAAAAFPGVFEDRAREADDLCAILYTSGTTGRAKGAMLTHENLLSNARALKDAWRFTSKDVLLHALPLFHMHGLFIASNVVLLAGASMVFRPKFDAAEAVMLMSDRRVTALMGVPTFYPRLLGQAGLTRESTAGMRLFVSGSAPLLPETHLLFREQTGHAILERYGMTETGIDTSHPYDGDRHPGTVGVPLSGVNVRITNPDTGDELSGGEIGMIEVKGPNVFKGYWRMEEKTQSEFRDGFFISGDLGKMDERGHLHIVGRSKDLIISGGFNVYPKEVEREIDSLPGVLESAVVGVPHPDFGEGVTALVVVERSANLKPDDIITSLSSRLAKFKLPKRIIFTTELPRNAMGKVQKNVIRDLYSSIFQ